MKGTTRRKVLTSGRLSGGVRGQPVRRKVTDVPEAAEHPEPTYSLYSTESEEQVRTLHQGLDRCAALLNGILQAEAVDRPQTLKDAATKPKPSTSAGKKSTKKQGPKKDQNLHRGPGRPRPRQPSPAPHTGVKPDLSKKKQQDLQSAKSKTPEPRPLTASPTSLAQALPTPQSAVGPSDRHQDGDGKLETVQRLMDELRTLIGRDSVVETLLDRLELAVTASNGELQMHNHDAQPLRNVTAMLLKEELKKDLDKEETQNLPESTVSVLQDQLAAAQRELQQLRDDVAELQKDLKDTQTRLTDRETDNQLLTTELDRARTRLQDSVVHQSQLSTLAQQRLEEVEKLQRVLLLHRRPTTAPPQDRIHHYLMSLRHQDPAHPEEEEVGVATETNGQEPHPGHVDRSHHEKRRSASEGDFESVTCDRTVGSESTFDTRAEVAFRDGLAALDASIASLQKTIQMDLVR